MRRWRYFSGAFFVGTALLLVASARGGPPTDDGQQRAGYPQNISWLARPSDTGRYLGYYVGGGAAPPRRADAPTAEDGTWGWDYQGGCLRRRVALGWWHGRRYQGGIGAYKTDGPHVLPSVEAGQSLAPIGGQ
jgi:hypothetical protein